jgi:hypothetical protein
MMTMTRIPCDEPGCCGQLLKTISAFEIESKIVGKISVPDVEQYKCNQCDYSQISVHSTDAILKYVRAKETEIINSLPIGEFVTPNQAIEILECTKQAFSKNVRIKRGFIISVIIGQKRLYHRKSVQLFKAANDGRYLVKPPTLEIQWVSPELPETYFYPESWVRQSRLPKTDWLNLQPAADNYNRQRREQVYG